MLNILHLTKTYLAIRKFINKELKLTLNILLLGPNKSLLFLALACLKNLGLSSEELLALVILSILRRIIVDNYATALLRA
ncbi:hypothetical protein HBI80_231200 [Parastagonospora nodorum]|nr:hypothetical protein HBI80_231200 [Parastagonospora nodorum]